MLIPLSPPTPELMSLAQKQQESALQHRCSNYGFSLGSFALRSNCGFSLGSLSLRSIWEMACAPLLEWREKRAPFNKPARGGCSFQTSGSIRCLDDGSVACRFFFFICRSPPRQSRSCVVRDGMRNPPAPLAGGVAAGHSLAPGFPPGFADALGFGFRRN